MPSKNEHHSTSLPVCRLPNIETPWMIPLAVRRPLVPVKAAISAVLAGSHRIKIEIGTTQRCFNKIESRKDAAAFAACKLIGCVSETTGDT